MAKRSGWSGVLKGGLIGVGAALAATVVCAVLITAAVIPERGGESCALFCAALGAMVAGWAARGLRREKGLLAGLLSGGITATVLTVSGFLLYGGIEMDRCGVVACLCLCCGAVASWLGGRKVGHKTR